eukprot:Skav229714  [mRNA]  locus=scaffold49:189255:192446:+ [translate_table: standard]
MTTNLTDATNVDIYHQYIHTHLNTDADTIKRGIEKGHYMKNQCWRNALIDYYGDTIMSETKRNRLTVERISQIIGRDDFTEKGASIKEMEKVFIEFRISVRILDFFNTLIYRYDPPVRNHHIKTFYALVKNKHIYALNYDIKQLQQKITQDIPIVKASTDYYINEDEEPPKHKMISDINDILKIEVPEDVDKIHLVSRDNDLTKLFFDLVNNGYEAGATHQTNIITDIRLKMNGILYKIRTQNLIKSSADGCITLDDEDTYNNMSSAMFKFNKALFNPCHKSHYTDIDIQILDEYKTIVPSGLLWREKDIPKAISEIDGTRAYTYQFNRMKEIPKFWQFDVWQVYDDTVDFDRLNDLTFFQVEVPENKLIKMKYRLLFNKDKGLMYKNVLKEVFEEDESAKKHIKLLAYKEPSKTFGVNYKEIYQELMKDQISKNPEEDKLIKKLLGNVNYGLLEKGGSTSTKSMPFAHLEEALEYQAEYGGKLHKISKTEEDVEGNDRILQNYFFLNFKDKAVLQNGYRYIKELLLQMHNLHMWKSYRILNKNKIKVYSVKTDAFVIDTLNVEKAKKVLDFHNDVGGWRVSKHNENIILPSVNYEIVKNEEVPIPVFENEFIPIEDEYNTKSIIDKIVELDVPHAFITAKLPGSGKSFIPEEMVKLGYKVLFVCHTNKLVQKYGDNAMTTNKFFGVGIGDTKLVPFDYSEYDCIVFDEIYCYGGLFYNKVWEFEKNNPKKIVIATGDAKQMKPIVDLTTTLNYEEYADRCMNKIFKYRIHLNTCKRLKTEEDKQKIINIHDDIFLHKLSKTEIIEKYFEYTDDITASTSNIAFLNDTCREVSRRIRELQNKTREYEIDEEVICREYIKLKNVKLNVNFRYRIKNILFDRVLLEDVKTLKQQYVPLQTLRKSLIFAYCFTCHSVQGTSVDDNITIFDYKHYRADRHWLWTCITRCTDLNNVKFYRYSDDKEDIFNKRCIMHYLNRKVQAYKEQDRAGKREIDNDNYIDAEWLHERLNSCCGCCGKDFDVAISEGNIYSNLSAQRLDCNQCHTKTNCVAYCVKCNCSASNKEKI